MKRIYLPLMTMFVASLFSSLASAQNFQTARTVRKPQPTRRPTVSPYLNLIQDENALDQALPVYQTLVRPFVEQRRLNQYQANQVFQLQQQVANNATRTKYGEQLRETGHATSYQNHSHYFPAFSGQR